KVMARKAKSDQVRIAEAAVRVKALDVFQTLMQDPLWSTMVGFWLQADVLGFSTLEKGLVRVGIIDINRARANVESTVLLELTKQSIDLVKSLGTSLAIAKAGALGDVGAMTIEEAFRKGEARIAAPVPKG
ncbi:unnamed protein product, partial [marine sediment metagenome]